MKYGLSTSSLRLMDLEEKFALTKELGFDGIEIMITPNREAHSWEKLTSLSQQYDLPILSIHAPTLIATHFVWGVKPYPKLARAAEHAAQVGAETVVVHPPYRWQPAYAASFLAGVRHVNATHGVHIAVENMYPWYVGKVGPVRAYGVSWTQTKRDAASVTFDFSHATVDGIDIVQEVTEILPSLRHIHLSDARLGSHVDAHLVPGNGNLPLRETFQVLKDADWQGAVVAEINTITAVTKEARMRALRQTLEVGRDLIS